jgi:cytochrome c
MDSFELNKIMGAVLGTLLFVMGAGFVAEAIYHPIEDRGPGYALPEPVIAEAGASAEAAAPAVPLGVLLTSASAERGVNAVKKCQSCHNFGEGEPNKQGPVLYDVVMRPEGSVPDFAYSEALLAHNAAGDVWSYENLDAFLAKPSDYAPGTKMNFAGVRTAEERADILAYLQTLSAEPKPFPAPEAAPVPVVEGEAPPAAPADGVGAIEGDPEEPFEDIAAPDEVLAPQENPVAAPAAPAAVTDTPVTTQQETQVQGTPTTSGTGPAPAPEDQVDAPPAVAPGASPGTSFPQTITPAPVQTP